jgi:amino acid transporter
MNRLVSKALSKSGMVVDPNHWYACLIFHLTYLIFGAVLLDKEDPGTIDGACPDLYNMILASVILGYVSFVCSVAGTIVALCKYSDDDEHLLMNGRTFKYHAWIKIVAGIFIFCVAVPLMVNLALTVQVVAREKCYNRWKDKNDLLLWWNCSIFGLIVLWLVHKFAVMWMEYCAQCWSGCCHKSTPAPQSQV